MFIGAIVFSAIVCTLVVTYLLHYCSQHAIFDLNDLPYTTPLGIGLTFLSSLLFSASLLMLIHTPINNIMSARLQSSNILATFAHGPFNSSYETIGYLPENAVAQNGVAMPTPLASLRPSYNQTLAVANTSSTSPTPTPADTEVVTASPTPTVTPTPTPSPTSTAVPPEQLATIAQEQESNLATSTDIYTIQVNGELKGYTSAFLHSITLYKDLLGDTRVMVTVNETEVSFYNLDSETEISATQLTPTQWQEHYADTHQLADVEAEEN